MAETKFVNRKSSVEAHTLRVVWGQNEGRKVAGGTGPLRSRVAFLGEAPELVI